MPGCLCYARLLADRHCCGAAEVTALDIARRADLGISGYEKIVGTIHFAVDPRIRTTASSPISTRRRATPTGRVEFSSDVYILGRRTRARQTAPRWSSIPIAADEVVITAVQPRRPSPDPGDEADLGDRFLMRFGYTLVWVGWEFDVARTADAMRIRVPVATDRGKTITGIVARGVDAERARAEVRRPRSRELRRRSIRTGPTATLAVRSSASGDAARPIARNEWRVKGHTVTLDGGFEPGKTYEIAYRAANPPVAGLGFVAMRDFAAWLKHQPDAAAPVRYTYALRLVAERPVPAQFPVRRLQHRRARSPGVRRRDGAHRRRGAHQPQRALVDADRPGRVQRDRVSVRRRERCAIR